MDPNANLAEQLRLAQRVIDGDYTSNATPERLAELVIALHEWIANGGFLPAAWVRK